MSSEPQAAALTPVQSVQKVRSNGELIAEVAKLWIKPG